MITDNLTNNNKWKWVSMVQCSLYTNIRFQCWLSVFENICVSACMNVSHWCVCRQPFYLLYTSYLASYSIIMNCKFLAMTANNFNALAQITCAYLFNTGKRKFHKIVYKASNSIQIFVNFFPNHFYRYLWKKIFCTSTKIF